jgi:hypothetical protein
VNMEFFRMEFVSRSSPWRIYTYFCVVTGA